MSAETAPGTAARAERSSSRASAGLVLFTLIAATVFAVLPPGSAGQAWLYHGIHAVMVIAIIAGVLLHRPGNPGTWWAIVVGHVLFGIANVYWYLGPELLGWELTFPGTADALYIPGYAIIGAAFWRLALLRSSHRGSTAVIEIAVVTLSLGAVVWLFLMAPYAADATIPVTTKLVALAYPTFDLVVVAVLATMSILPGRRPPAFWLLVGGLCATFLADILYALSSLDGTFRHGDPQWALWLLYFGLLGAAALHPSMRDLTRPAEGEDVGALWRPWALPVALAIPLLTLAYDQFASGRIHRVPVSLGIAAAVLLVAVRQSQLLREVAERTSTEARLVASRDAAVQASQMKSDFLATMSHEIRTPMNAVIGLSGLMMDTDLDDDQQRYASGIRTAGEALMAVINDILDFSKIEAGKLELEDVDFDLEATVEEVADLFSESARAKQLQIYSYLHPDVPRAVRADAGRLRQVLVNLVSNAVKFTESGRILIRVRTELEGSGDLLRFEVVDTGIGIAVDDHERLFEVFTQADASSSRRYGGTGLGLAICRQIVELMGGELGVTSTLGEGSTFWFTVPLRPLTSAQGERWTRPLEDIRVLVVDDDAVNRDIVERQTRAWGMRPVSVASADEALALLAADRDGFSVALLDLQMPGVDGLELAERMSTDERFRHVRIALLSSVDSFLAERRAAGVDEYLRKPVRQSQLYDVLMSLVLPGRAVDVPEAAPAPLPAGARGSVLLVEDNAANQLVGSRLVEKLGHRVDVVSDGEEALTALALRRYDAVLMDCQMPVMDGYEATRRLRDLEAHDGRHTPVIAMTAGVTLEDRRRCVEAGMDDFVAKPVRPETVAAALDRWLPASSSPAAPSETSGGDAPAGPSAGGGPVDEERWAVVVEMVHDDAEVLDQLVDVFTAEVPARLDDLRAAVRAGDAAEAAWLAHRVRGSALNLGATRLAELAEGLEQCAERGDVAGATTTVDALEAAFAEVAGVLRDRRGRR